MLKILFLNSNIGPPFHQINSGSTESEHIEEKKSKLEQIKFVLEMYGHFSGINRKVQLKYQPKGRPRNTSSDDGKNSLSKRRCSGSI